MHDDILDVAIIGAGFGGLAMARTLQREGTRRFRVFEQADAIGGTWRDNVYPGCACDVPSHLYSLSDAPNPHWSRLFPAQAEIRAYLDELAAPLQASGHVQLGFRLTRARWDHAAARWTLDDAHGTRVQARAVVLALGGLHVPAWPDIAGREDFAGTSLHTARWDPHIDLRGRRVAVIGTGASAVQLVPAIVDQVAQLHLFQRTPSWVLPRPDHAIGPRVRALLRALPPLRLVLRGAIFLWLEALSHGLLFPRSAFWARALARRHLRRQIPDPALRARLVSRHPIGCKRVLLSNDFYPALTRPHCELVDVPIERIERDGIRLADGTHRAVDTIVYATGFHPVASVAGIAIEGRDGHRLDRDWSDRPQAHLGISVHGHPNLFFLLGPNTALGHNSVLAMIQSQVRHVLAALQAIEARGARAIEATAEAQARFLADLDRRFTGTAWDGGCRSWYLDANGRNRALWIGSVLGYRRRTRRIRDDEYRYWP